MDKEWETEPSLVEGTDPESGYDYIIRRHPSMGTLCGYIKIPENHPLYEKDFSDEDFPSLNVHGGITFSDFYKALGEGYYIGFDCAHFGDLIPFLSESNIVIQVFGMLEKIFEPDKYSSLKSETYKNIEFVKNECLKLCKQIKDLEKND